MNTLSEFKQLKRLILDHNRLTETAFLGFPVMTEVTALFMNNNNIKNLDEFIICIAKCFPNLEILSLSNNPACPNQFNENNVNLVKEYR